MPETPNTVSATVNSGASSAEHDKVLRGTYITCTGCSLVMPFALYLEHIRECEGNKEGSSDD